MDDKVSNGQLEDLVEFLAEHPNLAKGVGLGPRSKETVDLLWSTLAQRLNSRGSGGTKTGVQWKKYWIGYKHRLKTKASNYIQHTRGTGGGPPSYDGFIEIERKVLGIMEEGAISGDTECQVRPFPFTSQSQRTASESHSSATKAVPPPVTASVTSVSSVPLEVERTECISEIQSIPTAVSTAANTQSTIGAKKEVKPPAQQKRKVEAWVVELEQRRIAAEEKLADAAKINAEAAKISAEAAKISAKAAKLNAETLSSMSQNEDKLIAILNQIMQKI